MSRPAINAQAVLMSATHLYLARVQREDLLTRDLEYLQPGSGLPYRTVYARIAAAEAIDLMLAVQEKIETMEVPTP